MRFKPQQSRVIDSTEGQLVLQRQKKKYRAPVVLETELLAVRSSQLLHAQASAQLQEQELQQHPALSALSDPAGTPAHYAGQLSPRWQQAGVDPAHSMQAAHLPAQQPMFSTTPSPAKAVQQLKPAIPGGPTSASSAHASSMQAPNSPAALRTSWTTLQDSPAQSAAQPAYAVNTDHSRPWRIMSSGYAEDTHTSHTPGSAAMQQQQAPASPLWSHGSQHPAAGSGLGAAGSLAAMGLGGQVQEDRAAAAAAAFMAGMHLQEFRQGGPFSRAKHSRSRDGSEEQQAGIEGMGEDAAAVKSPKLWYGSASTWEQQAQQQQPFLMC